MPTRSNTPPDFILKLSCPDHRGVLAAVSSRLAQLDYDIRDAAQYGDPETGLFFVRMHVRAPAPVAGIVLQQQLSKVAEQHRLHVEVRVQGEPMKTLIAVSQHGHCLNDLLHRWHAGGYPAQIVGVVSNHQDFASLSQWYQLPFHHLPVDESSKAEQERQLLRIMADSGAELLVLARYMQVLSAELCEELAGRCINIHHSFLPGFKGARPYHRAHARGVKLIGATAHYVTPELDEGPIIEQDLVRVTHATTAEEMVIQGREVEARVLARAVQWHAEHRVIMNGMKTIVFS